MGATGSKSPSGVNASHVLKGPWFPIPPVIKTLPSESSRARAPERGSVMLPSAPQVPLGFRWMTPRAGKAALRTANRSRTRICRALEPRTCKRRAVRVEDLVHRRFGVLAMTIHFLLAESAGLFQRGPANGRGREQVEEKARAMP